MRAMLAIERGRRGADRTTGPAAIARLVLLTLLVPAAGCGGGEATSLGGELRPIEARRLADLFADQTSTVLEAHAEEAPSPDSPLSISDEVLFSRSAPCPGGGTVTVAGRVNRKSLEGDPTMSLDFSLSVLHEECVLRGTDRRVVLTAAPGISGDAHYAKTSTALEGPQTAEISGILGWSASDSASGRCEVGIRTRLDPETGALRVTGSVCGVSVDDVVDRAAGPASEASRTSGS